MGKALAGLNDGMVFTWADGQEPRIVAEGIRFANGMAFDFSEEHLYVCETTGCDILRYPILPDGSLGEPSQYGPRLGLDSSEVQQQRPLGPDVRSKLGLTDGCGFDAEGNLWVTLVMANKIVAITPTAML